MSGSISSLVGKASAIAGLSGITDALGLTSALLLGGVSFLDFEVPESIGFGGAQQLTVHKLPGGQRVIDAMGRDDRNIDWSGIFLSPDATARAQQIDQLRIAGAPVTLAWGGFLYTVVVSSFECDYKLSSWIPYRISCTVLQDQTDASATSYLDAAIIIATDLYSAYNALSALSPPSPPSTSTAADEAAVTAAAGVAAASCLAAQTAAAAAGDWTLGSTSYTAGVLVLQGAQGACQTGVTTAGTELLAVSSQAPSGSLVASAGDLLAAAYIAGELAGLAQAQGFAGRAASNAVLGST